MLIDCNIMLSHWNMVTSGHFQLMHFATYKNRNVPQAHRTPIIIMIVIHDA